MKTNPLVTIATLVALTPLFFVSQAKMITFGETTAVTGPTIEFLADVVQD